MESDIIAKPVVHGQTASFSLCNCLSQTSCQTRRAFTLLELLVVIVIIGILGSALMVSVQSGYKQARQANCKSNLRQFGVALTIYRGEHDNKTPGWISNLYPEYVDDRAMYVCRADRNGGRDRVRPKEFVDAINDSTTLDAPKYLDNQKGSGNTRNTSIECCSYFYEFSAAETSWTVLGHTLSNPHTMGDYKMAQMTYGDENSGTDESGNSLPYSASRIPIIRCYHHWHDQKILGVGYADRSSRRATRQYITINVAYAGNVFVGPPWWEGTIHPGETRH